MPFFTIHLPSMLLIMAMAVDIANGFFLWTGGPSISAPYKIVTLASTWIALLISGKAEYLTGMLLTISTYLLIHISSNGSSGATEGIEWLLRFFLIASTTIYLIAISKQADSSKLVKRILLCNFVVLTANFAIGSVGYGFPVYQVSDESGIGVKGFIFAGNEAGGAIIAIGGGLMAISLMRSNLLAFFGTAGLTVAMSSLLASKTAIIGSLLLAMILPSIKIRYEMNSFKIKRKWALTGTALLILLPTVSVMAAYFILVIQDLKSRIDHFFDPGNLLGFILSNRDQWTHEALSAFYHRYDLSSIMFGTGRHWFNYIADRKMVEIDVIDFLMSYGVFGILLTYGSLTLFLMVNKPNAKNMLFYPVALLLIGISLTSGHIFNSGFAAISIGCLLYLIHHNTHQANEKQAS